MYKYNAGTVEKTSDAQSMYQLWYLGGNEIPRYYHFRFIRGILIKKRPQDDRS